MTDVAPIPTDPNEIDLSTLPVTMGVPMNEQEDGLLHVPPEMVGRFALEMVEHMERRIRELNPDADPATPVCGGCVLAALENMTIIAVVKSGRRDGRLQDKLLQIADDFVHAALKLNPIRFMLRSFAD